MSHTRSWALLFRGLPEDVQTDETFLAILKREDGHEIIAFLEAKATEAHEQEASLRTDHPELAPLAHRHERQIIDDLFADDIVSGRADSSGWDALNDDLKAQVEWYAATFAAANARRVRLDERVRFAKDVMGIEPYWPPESDD